MTDALAIAPPDRIPWYLRPALWLTRRITGKDPLPARLLTHFPKAAIGAGIFEALTPHAPGDLDARTLAAARISASVVAGCPFCIDMNAATWRDAGFTETELRALLALDWSPLTARERVAAELAAALSRTPVEVPPALGAELNVHFTARERVVLATTVAQVNYWSRFNQALGVPAAGFFDESVCALPVRH